MRIINGRVLFLVFIWVVGSESIRPSDHGLDHEKAAVPVSPAMVTFFHGQPKTELPEALNTTTPAWAARFTPPEPSSGRTGRTRTALLVAGLLCGFIGVGLLATAAVVYLGRVRRTKPGVCSGSGLGSIQWRNSPQIQLGS